MITLSSSQTHAGKKKKRAAYAKSFSFPAEITGLTHCKRSDAEEVNGGHQRSLLINSQMAHTDTRACICTKKNDPSCIEKYTNLIVKTHSIQFVLSLIYNDDVLPLKYLQRIKAALFEHWRGTS